MSRRLLILACAAALVTAACNSLPEGEVEPGQGVRFVPQVADFVDDAGLGNAIAVDAEGVPYVSYLIFPAEPEEGEIAVPRPIGAPYIFTEATPATGDEPAVPARPGAAVGVASLADNGIWTRGAAAQVRDNPSGIVVPFGPATVDSLIGADALDTNGTDIAIDGEGGKHVVWTGNDGIYYAGGTSSFTAERLYDFGIEVSRAGAIGRASVAVDADGTPWVAFTVGGGAQRVRVATKDGDTWSTETIAEIGQCADCSKAGVTQIGLTATGPTVVYADLATEEIVAATRQGQTWVPETVATGTSGDGLAMAVDQDGNPFVTSYGADGSVELATREATGWATVTVAEAGPSSADTAEPTPTAASPGTVVEPTANLAPTTGVAVDQEGVVYATWYDGATDSVLLASSQEEGFAPIPTGTSTVGGATPSVAVAPDGSRVYLAWYDAENQDLRLGVHGDIGELTVARPSPTPDPGVVPPPGEECGEGPEVLDIVALNVSFDPTCLVAPAGEPFEINFDNQDDAALTGQHNIVIADTQADVATNPLFRGDLISGPDETAYPVDPLDAGQYFFQCEIHPTMTGALAAVEAKGGKK